MLLSWECLCVVMGTYVCMDVITIMWKLRLSFNCVAIYSTGNYISLCLCYDNSTVFPPQGIYQMFGILADVAVIGMLVYIIQRYVFTIIRIVYGGDIHYHCTPKEDVGLTYT